MANVALFDQLLANEEPGHVLLHLLILGATVRRVDLDSRQQRLCFDRGVLEGLFYFELSEINTSFFHLLLGQFVVEDGDFTVLPQLLHILHVLEVDRIFGDDILRREEFLMVSFSQ